MKPIAIVTPWFGKELKGGAEQLAWQLAVRLTARGHRVEVLTTCCRSFLADWATNHFKPGRSVEKNVPVRRFLVDKRNVDQFNEANALMLSLPKDLLMPGINPVSIEVAHTFVEHNINSTDLLAYLKKQAADYQAIAFLPYLYGPILKGVALVAENAVLIPCLHNEAYAYLPQVAAIFQLAKNVVFNSEGEAQLAARLFGPGIFSKNRVAGVGIEMLSTAPSDLPNKVASFELSANRYILYLGRRDATKNVDMLIGAFRRFQDNCPDSSLKLVLAGPGERSYNGTAQGLVDLGLVAEDEKAALLANSLALFQPSDNESYSRVMMESWFYKRPVAAHSLCPATALAVRSAQGGWLAGNEAEWAQLFEIVEHTTEPERLALGSQGLDYAKKYADWERVIDRYEAIFGLQEAIAKTTPLKSNHLKEIHQITPGFTFGDAISNQALVIRDYLRAQGYASKIFVQYLDPSMAAEAEEFQAKHLAKKAGLIYHHSIGSDLTQAAIDHPGPNCLVYHNITPAEFFRSYDPHVARLLEAGRDDLERLAQKFPIAVGDSAYNACELTEFGFSRPGVLPICVDPNKWAMEPDVNLMTQLQDGKTNLLFVGRISPNKCQHHLVEAFDRYLTMDPAARLILAGGFSPNEAYYNQLADRIDKLGLKEHVVLTGKISDTQLQSYYRTAHLYWSMSEHEGFGVPLVEAMWFDIPVLAYKCTAVPETLGTGGIMFTDKDDLVVVAALAKLLVHDSSLRFTVLDAQRQRRQAFLPTAITPIIDQLIDRLESSAGLPLS